VIQLFGRMIARKTPVEPTTTSKYQRLFGIRLRALVLALFAYVGSGIGVSAVRTLEVFAGSDGESLPVLEATEVRRRTFHETHLHIVLDKLDYVDHACIDLLSNWEKQHKGGGGQIIMEWDKLHRKYFDRSALAASGSASV
jgi:hypothetical protein